MRWRLHAYQSLTGVQFAVQFSSLAPGPASHGKQARGPQICQLSLRGASHLPPMCQGRNTKDGCSHSWLLPNPGNSHTPCITKLSNLPAPQIEDPKSQPAALLGASRHTKLWSCVASFPRWTSQVLSVYWKLTQVDKKEPKEQRSETYFTGWGRESANISVCTELSQWGHKWGLVKEKIIAVLPGPQHQLSGGKVMFIWKTLWKILTSKWKGS